MKKKKKDKKEIIRRPIYLTVMDDNLIRAVLICTAEYFYSLDILQNYFLVQLIH